MPDFEFDTGEFMVLASRLLDREVISITALRGGGNNRVFRIETENEPLALKFYPSQDEDPRDRLGQEFSALKFLSEKGVTCVPAAIKSSQQSGCAIYQWIEGAPPKEPTESDIDAMLDFTRELVTLKASPDARRLAPASAHCFSPEAVCRQLQDRFDRIMNVSDGVEELQVFLNVEFAPLLQVLIMRANHLCGMSDAPLPFDFLTLSPSDFGVHNALQKRDGKLIFIDFEYFGWDDPVKMISDVIWHPGSNLPSFLSKRYFQGAHDIFLATEGKSFSVRFGALHPLFGMIWCLIKLNEFLPERWHRRVVAGQSLGRREAQSAQLESARATLKRIQEITNE